MGSTDPADWNATVCLRLKFVLESLGRPVPPDVAARRYWTRDGETALNANKRTLVALLDHLSESDADKVLYNGRDKRCRDLLQWWEQYTADREEEREQHRKRLIRKQVREKLTAEEWDALGVDDD